MPAHATVGLAIVASACLLVGGAATAGYADSGAVEQPAVTQADFNAEELTILTQLDAALSQRQAALDAELSALAAATDPAVKQPLQHQVDHLQGEIKELTRLKEELLAPIPPEAGSSAAQAAASLDEHIDRQEQRSDVILDNRAAGAGP